MSAMTIGKLAKRADVGVETIRFYERQGLLPEPPRTTSGYRQYPWESVERLRFIQRAKELGFSLRETSELISLRLDEGSCAADVRPRAEDKAADIDEKIRDLQRMRTCLAQLMEACTGQGGTEACAILDALSRTGPGT